MANYRPKSLSELNNVYDKAMRAEKAIKEGSSKLSVPEATPQSENIFAQLETKAAEAEKSQVFDPDITNIANDFLRRYAQPQQPSKPASQEVKRPAPSIQSVYHTPAKVKQDEPKDVPLNMGGDFASTIQAPAVPLHKPAATIPAAQPEAVKEPETLAEAPAPQVAEPAVSVPETAVISTPAEPETPAVNVSAPAVKEPTRTPPRKVSPRVRITSTERSELMEEYLRVMSDDDDEPSYKKPMFSFFKKKKKHDEEVDDEPATSLYEELPEEDDSAEDEVPVVPFDSSDVKYTDEYSDSPAEDTAEVPEENMDIYDYIEADFDYGEDDEDDTLDVSMETNADVTEKVEAEATEEEAAEAEEILPEEAEIVYEAQEEAEEVVEVTEEADAPEEPQDSAENAEDVVYPTEADETEEAEEVVYPDAPPSDMVFEDIFSVTDETKRSHTGGNWEEVFGANFNASATDSQQDNTEYSEYTETEVREEVPYEEYPADEEETSYEEYPADEDEQDEEYAQESDGEEKPNRKKGFLKFLMVFVAVICIINAGVTILLASFTDVNSGKLISDKYRLYSVSENIDTLGLSAGDLVITENAYAHTDDLYVYTDSESGAYNFGKVKSSTSDILGDYLYMTESSDGISLVNRDNSMGVVIATYATVGSILSVICDYYIFIAGAMLILAVAMIICLVLISKKSSDAEPKFKADEDKNEYDDTDNNDSDTDTETDEDDGEYYSDYDTDGIEEGLFSGI